MLSVGRGEMILTYLLVLVPMVLGGALIAIAHLNHGNSYRRFRDYMENLSEKIGQCSNRQIIYVTLEGPRRRPFLSYYIDWKKLFGQYKQEDKKEILFSVLTDLISGIPTALTKRYVPEFSAIVSSFSNIYVAHAGLIDPDDLEQIIIYGDGDPSLLIQWLKENEYKTEAKQGKY
jgi:hypothetical protein